MNIYWKMKKDIKYNGLASSKFISFKLYSFLMIRHKCFEWEQKNK